MIVINNKNLLYGSLVFFVVWMLLMPHITLAKSADNSNLPPEFQDFP
jgi:hypothetical protein